MKILNLNKLGADKTGKFSSDAAKIKAIDELREGGIIEMEAGNYKFSEEIETPENIKFIVV